MRRCTRIMGTTCFFCLLLMDCCPTLEQLLDTPASASVKLVLEDLHKHAVHAEQRMKSTNAKAEKKRLRNILSSFQTWTAHQDHYDVHVQRKREGMGGRMLKTEEETGVTAPTADGDVSCFICGALGHWARDCPHNDDDESSYRGHQPQRGKGHHDQCPRSAASNRRHQSAVNGGQSAGVETQPAIATVGSGTHRHTPRQNSNRLTTHYTMHCNFYLISAHIFYVFTVHRSYT